MSLTRIGVSSPLLRDEMPTPDMGVTQHCAILKKLGVTPVILRNDDNPLEAIREFRLDGIIFSGGGDVAPGSYGGDSRFAQEVDFRRDAFESALMERAFKQKLPIFAICRGMQLANVIFEGTLVEDLRERMGAAYSIVHDQVGEVQLPYYAYAHDIKIMPDTLLYSITENYYLRVNSIHHQAIDELASVFKVTARAADGIIEAIELQGNNDSFFLGVQWHPEWLPGDPSSQRLYARFLWECKSHPTSGSPGCSQQQSLLHSPCGE
jgi:putative glutamine amidotransferase